MHGILLFIHIVVCILLVVVVLLQSGKSADLAGAFGGVGSQSTFGPRGTASLLSKMTTTLAVLFMITSLILYLSASPKTKVSSVVGGEKAAPKTQQKSTVPPPATQKPGQQTTTTPATPATDKPAVNNPPQQTPAPKSENTSSKTETPKK